MAVALAAAGATLLAAAGCTATTPAPRPSPSLPPHTGARIGQEVTTAHGNRVWVIRYLKRVPGGATHDHRVPAAIEARVCAAAGQSTGVALRVRQFMLLFHDGTLPPAAAVTKRPMLSDGEIAPGTCHRGWIGYLRPAGEQPIGVLLSSSSVVLWLIP